MALKWTSIKPAFTLKSFYIALIVALVGSLLIAIGQLGLTGTWQTIIVGLGLTLLTSSTVSFLSEVFVRLDVLDLIDASLRRQTTANPRALLASGLTDYGSSRRYFSFGGLVSSARSELLILGISANDVLSPATLDRIAERVLRQQQLCVRILLLDPASDAAILRSKSSAYESHDGLQNKYLAVRSELDSVSTRLLSAGVAPSRFMVKLYARAPVLSLVLNEHSGVVSFFLEHTTGGRSPFFAFTDSDHGDNFYGQVRSHFEALWNAPVA
jgi:hypothetical protein